MDKKVILTEKAPQPLGPYSQAIKAGNTLYISGQIAINVADGKLVTDDISAETHQVMKNILTILQSENLSFDNVVKSSIFLADMNNFSKVNEAYGSYFKTAPPARETVEVSALPKFVNVEISTIAYY